MNGSGPKLDHVALGVDRIADALGFVVGELGGEPYDGGPGPGFRWVQWRFAGGGVLELLEPTGQPGGFLHRFLERRGPGVHHVTFKVPSLEAAADRARAHGYEIVGWLDLDPSWRECFLHPKQAQGIVVQLAESNPDAGGGVSDGPDVALPMPDDPPPPVVLQGVRLSARDAGAARRQWQDVLGGQARELGEGGIELRWPDSPLRVVVEIHPDAPEGPIGLEVGPGRGPDAWPDGERRALGARFVRVADPGPAAGEPAPDRPPASPSRDPIR